MAQTRNTQVFFQMTKPGVLGFPNLVTARRYKDPRTGVETGEPKYDFQVLLSPDHPDIPGLVAACKTAARQEWPGADFDNKQSPTYMAVDYCLRAGDAKVAKARNAGKTRDMSAYAGKFVLTSRGKYAPGIGAVVNGTAVDFPQSGPERAAACATHYYGGALVLCKFEFIGYQVGSTPPCVTAYPVVLMAVGGERIPELGMGEGHKASSTFTSEHIGAYANIDPAAGMPVGASGIPGL